MLAQFDFSRERLTDRMTGPTGNSGTGVRIAIAAMTRDDYRFSGDPAGAIATGAEAWRAALSSADDAALDQVGRSSYPNGSDPEQPFIDIVWWVNQELLHHGAEIALPRDLYRARQD